MLIWSQFPPDKYCGRPTFSMTGLKLLGVTDAGASPSIQMEVAGASARASPGKSTKTKRGARSQESKGVLSNGVNPFARRPAAKSP